MEDYVKFDGQTPAIIDPVNIRSIMGVDKNTGLVGNVLFNTFVVEAGKNVSEAVKITSTALPTLGDANKTVKVLGGTNGKAYTYSGATLNINPNYEGILFWDGVLKTWSIQVQEPMPVSEGSKLIVKNGTLPASTGGVYSEFDNFKTGITRLFPVITPNSYLNNDGVIITATSSFVVSAPIPVVKGDRIIYGGRTNAGSNSARALWGFDANGAPVKLYLATVDASTQFIEVPILEDNVVKVVACWLGTEDYFIGKKGRIIEKSAIKGMELIESDVETFKSLLFDKQKVSFTSVPAYVDKDGASVAIGTWFSSDFIEVQYGKKYYYQGRTNIGSGIAYAITGYNANKERVLAIQFNYDSVTSGLLAFIISNTSIIYIKICSYKDVELALWEESSSMIPQAKVQGLVGLAEDVEILKNGGSSGDGKLNTNVSYASIGDSITAFDATAGNKGYQSWIQDYVRFTSHTNYGFSGRSLTSAEDRASIIDGTVNLGAFGFYTILVGTNDFKLNRPIGTVDDYLNNTGPNTFYGAYRVLIDRIFAKNILAEAFIMTPLKRDNDGYTSFSTNTAGHKLDDYCEVGRWVAKREGLYLVDLNRYSGINERNLFQKTSDGLHPLSTGHKDISKPMIQGIKMIYG